jgi:hypothetical protein
MTCVETCGVNISDHLRNAEEITVTSLPGHDSQTPSGNLSSASVNETVCNDHSLERQAQFTAKKDLFLSLINVFTYSRF